MASHASKPPPPFGSRASVFPPAVRAAVPVVDESSLLDAAEVREEDLSRLAILHRLLGVLNDPRASAAALAEPIAAFPALSARITRSYLARQPPRSGTILSRHERKPPPLVEQVARLGNRQVEIILLGLLEDLTELQAARS